MFDLDAKIILVTGGYGHLGTTMCEGLSNSGAIVYALGRSQDKFDARFGRLNTHVQFRKFDIDDPETIKRVFSRIFDRHNKIDVLINNAAYIRGNEPLSISDSDWDISLGGVLSGVYRCIREITPYFLKQQYGKIINISSMYGMISPDFRIYEDSPNFLNPPHYGAAKAGVIQLTKYFAEYLGPSNIHVNCISPGPFPSDMVQLDSAFVHQLEQKTSLRKIGQPADLVGPVVFLSSPASDFITGHNLVVDGGWTIT